jgi:hypothetical protein
MPVIADGMRQISTQVPEAVYADLMRLLKETGRSLSREVTRALERHLAADCRPRVVEPAYTGRELIDPAAEPVVRKGRPRKPKEAAS